MTNFQLPKSLLQHASQGSWGPPKVDADDELQLLCEGLPYQPYHKSDKICRVADWYNSSLTAPVAVDDNQKSFNNAPLSLSIKMAYSSEQAQDDASFSLVDHKSATMPSTPTTPWGSQARKSTSVTAQTPIGSMSRRENQPQRKKDSSIQVGTEWKQVQEFQMFQFNKMAYSAPSGKHLSLAAKQALTVTSGGPQVEADLLKQGQVFGYDRAFDRITPKTTKPLVRHASLKNAKIKDLTASQDVVLQSFLESSEKLKQLYQESNDVVYITSSVLAAMMTLHRSISGWDIVVTKKSEVVVDAQGKEVVKRYLTFDKREGSPLDLQFVHDTAPQHPMLAYANPGTVSSTVDYAPFDVGGDKDHPWSPLNLARETTNAAKMFAQMSLIRNENSRVILGDSADKDLPVAEQRSKGINYRVWKLTPAKGSTKPLLLVARTDTDAHMAQSPALPQPQLVHIRALTEHFPIDPSTKQPSFNYVPWTTKFAKNQLGAVFASEMRANAFLWARWCCESILSGTELIKIGFLTRSGGARGYLSRGKNLPPSQLSDLVVDGSVKDGQYVVLGTQSVKCEDLAQQLNLNMSQSWGIVKSFIDLFLAPAAIEDDEEQVTGDALADGRYIVWRDPNATKVKVYRLPADTKLEGLDKTDEEQQSEI